MASALAPALSPRRGRIVRRSFAHLYDWIGRTFIRKTENMRKLFPLLGERIKGEGGCKRAFHLKRRGSKKRDRRDAGPTQTLPQTKCPPADRRRFFPNPFSARRGRSVRAIAIGRRP